MKALQFAAFAAVLATAVAVPSGTARADSNSLFFTSNGGFVCKPANGVYSNFTFATTLVRNVSASTQTLICNLPQIRPSVSNFSIGTSGYYVQMLFANTNTTQITISCTATVSYAGLPDASASTTTQSLTLASGAAGQIIFDDTQLIINDESAPVNIQCLLPSKAAFGRIDQWMP
jgi:hypothetical protein